VAPNKQAEVRDLRPLADLVLLPDNPRHGDIGALTESLARFGQQKPIVVNSAGVILAGNHTAQAAMELGWELIWVEESELQGPEQNAFALADNRLSDLATYDHQILLEQLKQLDSLDGTGYDADDMDELLAKALHEHDTGLAPDLTFPEKLMNWEAQGGTRSVVLLYEIEEYRQVVARLKELGQRWDLETNSQVMLRLLEEVE
jgi:ParB-like chromosome segregation protein Spo0J